jgi:hypothetical protein
VARSGDSQSALSAKCTDTSATGAFAIADLEPGEYTVTAEAEGFVARESARRPVVLLAAGEARDGVDIALDPGGERVAGVVLDASGGPIEGAWIRAASAPLAAATRSAADGRFRLWLPPGPATLSAQAVGYAPAQRDAFAPGEGVVLTLIPGSSVSGQVVDATDGAPVANIDVRVVASGKWGSTPPAFTRTGADGEFTLHGLLPTRAHVVAEGEGRRGESAPFDVGLLDSVDRVIVKVSAAATVSGHVALRAGGAPCAQGSVQLGQAGVLPSPYELPEEPDRASAAAEGDGLAVPSLTADLDGSGDVRLRAVPPGVYHVVVRCAGYRWADGPRVVRVASANVEGLRWTVEQGPTLVVHVTDEARRPVPGAPFQLLWPARASDHARAAMALAADGDGRCEVPASLHPGTYTLEPAGGYAGEPTDFEVRDRTGTIEQTLTLRGQGAIVVRVTTAEGGPVDDVTVTGMPVKGTTGLAAFLSGADLGGGRFRIGPLAPGRYTVRVSDGANPARTDAVDVSAGADVETKVVMDRGGRIRGRIVDRSGQPVPDAWIRSDCSSGSGRRTPGEIARLQAAAPFALRPPTISDLQGNFEIAELSAGRCSLQATIADGSSGVVSDVPVGDTGVIVTVAALAPERSAENAETKGASN